MDARADLSALGTVDEGAKVAEQFARDAAAAAQKTIAEEAASVPWWVWLALFGAAAGGAYVLKPRITVSAGQVAPQRAWVPPQAPRRAVIGAKEARLPKVMLRAPATHADLAMRDPRWSSAGRRAPRWSDHDDEPSHADAPAEAQKLVIGAGLARSPCSWASPRGR